MAQAPPSRRHPYIQTLNRESIVSSDKSFSLKAWCTTAERLLERGKYAQAQKDFDRAYVCLMKFSNIVVDVLPKLREYPSCGNGALLKTIRDLNLAASDVLKQLESLQQAIVERVSKAEDARLRGAAVFGANTLEHFSVSAHQDMVTPEQVRQLLEERSTSLLLIDIRSPGEFRHDHIQGNVISIDPSIVGPGLTVASVSSHLDLKFKALFNKRDRFDQVVVYDGDSLSLAANAKLKMVKDAVYSWDFEKTLKRPPAVLQGGYSAFARRFPGLCGAGLSAADGPASVQGPPPMPRLSEPAPWLRPKERPHGAAPAAPSPNESAAPTINRSLLDWMQGPTGARNTRLSSSKPHLPPPSALEPRETHALYPAQTVVRNTGVSMNALQPSSVPAPRHSVTHEDLRSLPLPLPLGQGQPRPTQSIRAAAPGSSETGAGTAGLQPRMLLASQSTPIVRQPAATELAQRAASPAPLPTDGTLGTVPMRRSSFSMFNSETVGSTGLKNLGNTCFMNATTQCLSGTLPLARYFLEGDFRRHLNLKNPMGTRGVLAEAFADLLKMLWSGQYPYISPKEYREAIGSFAPQFGTHEQQDAHELLAFLLDGLHEDLNLVGEKPKLEPVRHEDPLGEKQLAERTWSDHLKRDNSIIVMLFQGLMKSTVCCLTCQKSSLVFNPFMYLTLPIPSPKIRDRSTDIYDCLDLLTKEERLDESNRWSCPQCRVPRSASKKLDLWTLPPILLVHLKRFSFAGPWRDKLDTMVGFPLRELRLHDHLSHAQHGSVQCTYDLFAVVNHYGGLEGGHYTAFCRNVFLESWCHYDDTKVTPLDEEDVETRNAYILFYVRRDGSK